MSAPQKSGSLGSWAAPSEDELRQVHNAEELEKLGERFEQLGAMRSLGQGLWADDRGRLWQHDSSFEGHNPERNAFAVGQDLEPVWFARPTKGPTTLDQLEVRQARRAKAAEQQEREWQARLKEARRIAQPVTFGQVETSARGVTLAEAARRIANVGGKVEVRGGRLVVSLPPAVPGGTGSVLVFARMLYAAEAVAVEALSKGQDLPEREITPAGALV
jgi:hypothetical protein